MASRFVEDASSFDVLPPGYSVDVLPGQGASTVVAQLAGAWDERWELLTEIGDLLPIDVLGDTDAVISALDDWRAEITTAERCASHANFITQAGCAAEFAASATRTASQLAAKAGLEIAKSTVVEIAKALWTALTVYNSAYHRIENAQELLDRAATIRIATPSGTAPPSLSGTYQVVAGNGTRGQCDNGQPATGPCIFYSPRAMTADAGGNLYFSNGPSLAKVAPDGSYHMLLGISDQTACNTGYPQVGESAPGDTVCPDVISGMTTDPEGKIDFVDLRDLGPNQIEIVLASLSPPDDEVTTLAYIPVTQSVSAAGGSHTSVASAPDGALFVSDPFDGQVYRYTAETGAVLVSGASSCGGTNSYVGCIDGPGSLATDSAGDLFIDDENVIKEITPNSTVSVVAGAGSDSGCDPNTTSAARACLDSTSITVSSQGVLYSIDQSPTRVDAIANGQIKAAIVPSSSGSCPSSGPTSSACMSSAEGGMTSDAANHVFVAGDAEIYKFSGLGS